LGPELALGFIPVIYHDYYSLPEVELIVHLSDEYNSQMYYKIRINPIDKM
jgi:hypothetical protein